MKVSAFIGTSQWNQTRGIMNLIKKNSILSYFILTFLISWGYSYFDGDQRNADHGG